MNSRLDAIDRPCPALRAGQGQRERVAALATTLLLACSSCSGGTSSQAPPAPTGPPFAIEVIVRTPANFTTPADVSAFVAMAAANGVREISVLAKQDEDSAAIPSGAVYYPSAIAPVAPGYAGFDVLGAMVAQAHARGIKVRAWVPQFHDQAAAKAHPAWQMMALVAGQVVPYTGSSSIEYFVNPLDPAVQAYELSILQEIAAHYAVDGFMLDWIRFDNFDMDLGAFTRQAYQAAGGPDPVGIDFTTANAARDAWNAWRTDGVAAYAHAVRQALPAATPIGVYILPPEFVEVGQDAAKFRRDADTLDPMCYFRDWGYPLDWWWSSCMASTAVKAGATRIAPAMDSDLTDAQYLLIAQHLRSTYPQVGALAWFYHGAWDATRMASIARVSHF
jgi:hypothetical protein